MRSLDGGADALNARYFAGRRDRGGWALRASAKYPVISHLSLEPYYVRWNVSSSPVNYEIATFTVNNVTAQEQLGAYEPVNVTNEFGVRLGLHF